MAGRRSPQRHRRVTMTQVARHAGVSQTTVSFVLNNRTDIAIAPDTRARVLEAARELDFHPNRAAQSLRSNRSFTVGVIADRVVSDLYAGQLVMGIQQAVQSAGYVCFVIEASQAPDSGAAAARNLLAQGVAGIAYVALTPEPVDPMIGPDDARTAYANCWPADGRPGSVVLADEYGGGRAAAAAVFQAGHRDIAFLGGTRGEYACQERERGLDDAATANGIDPASIPRTYGDYEISSGYTLANQELSRTQRPTALICGNDRMATGAIMAIQSAGLRCPDDISVIGFDNHPGLADQIHPALTTVALPHFAMGQTAGRLLLDTEESPHRELIQCPYIQRDSLAAPRTH